MNITVVKSVTVKKNFACLLIEEERFGVAQNINDDFKVCFYDTRDLAEEVFEIVAGEVMSSE